MESLRYLKLPFHFSIYNNEWNSYSFILTRSYARLALHRYFSLWCYMCALPMGLIAQTYFFHSLFQLLTWFGDHRRSRKQQQIYRAALVRTTHFITSIVFAWLLSSPFILCVSTWTYDAFQCINFKFISNNFKKKMKTFHFNHVPM